MVFKIETHRKYLSVNLGLETHCSATKAEQVSLFCLKVKITFQFVNFSRQFFPVNFFPSIKPQTINSLILNNNLLSELQIKFYRSFRTNKQFVACAFAVHMFECIYVRIQFFLRNKCLNSTTKTTTVNTPCATAFQNHFT